VQQLVQFAPISLEVRGQLLAGNRALEESTSEEAQEIGQRALSNTELPANQELAPLLEDEGSESSDTLRVGVPPFALAAEQLTHTDDGAVQLKRISIVRRKAKRKILGVSGRQQRARRGLGLDE
jgi:hypothetical protein